MDALCGASEQGFTQGNGLSTNLSDNGEFAHHPQRFAPPTRAESMLYQFWQ